jgi:peptidyl-prolyl cis-trans isomerase SurA
MRTCRSSTRPKLTPDARRGRAPRAPALLALIVAVLAAGTGRAVRAEVIEEIVARINDSIITLSQLRERESRVVGELFSRYSGEELDKRVSEARATLLRDMVRETLLLQRAESLGLDTEKIIEVGIEQIKRQNDIKTNDELIRLLREQGSTLEELREQVLRFNVPPIMLDREVRQKVSVTENEIEAYYKEHVEEFRIPASVTFSEIVVKQGEETDEEALKARAEAALAELRGGAAFEAVAQTYSDSPSRAAGGKVGPIRPSELARSIEKALAAMTPGQVSPAVRSGYGFHILRLDERVEEKQRDLAEVRDSIEEQIRARKTEQETAAYFDKLRGENLIQISPAYKRYGEP